MLINQTNLWRMPSRLQFSARKGDCRQVSPSRSVPLWTSRTQWAHIPECAGWQIISYGSSLTLRNPVLRSKFKFKFLISPNSENLSKTYEIESWRAHTFYAGQQNDVFVNKSPRPRTLPHGCQWRRGSIPRRTAGDRVRRHPAPGLDTFGWSHIIPIKL